MSMLARIESLRLEALREVWGTPALATVRALDEAVVAAGGRGLIASDANGAPAKAHVIERAVVDDPKPIRPKAGSTKVSQGDAAEIALREKGPLPVGRLMEASMQHGAVFGGEKPLVSFRSMLSKDERFRSITRNNMYFWWLNDTELPAEFKPGPSTDIDDLLGIRSTASERGGDQNGSSTT